MRTAVTLIRESDETVALTLDGIFRKQQAHRGRVTSRPVSDLSPQADGILREPIRISLEGTIPTNTVPTGTLLGQSRVQEVIDTLTGLQISGERVAVYAADEAGVASMLVESFAIDSDPSEDPGLSVELVERRFARARTVQLQPIPAAVKGPPRADVADDFAETAEQGPMATTPVDSSLFLQGLQTFGLAS